MVGLSFIEKQFPVGRISKECFKERKAGSGQTLTGVGKWWGRKPLFLVRSTLLGCLMPSSQDPKKDLDIFQKILTIDDEGVYQRKKKGIPSKRLQEILGLEWGDYQKSTKIEKKLLEKKAFLSLGYDEKITYCLRPEHVSGPSKETWEEINDHLGTSAISLSELTDQLGKKLWGHKPRVGDAFCGGGSVPFEAARMGADIFASDLNPVATLLTWGAINLLGASDAERAIIEDSLKNVYERVDQKICELSIEHNPSGERGDAYLYCVEAICPATGYLLPLAPSWIVSEKYRVCCVLKKDEKNKRYAIEIIENPDDATWGKAQQGTVAEGYMICPETGDKFSIRELRGDNKIDGKSIYGLRAWGNNDIMPKEDDLFQERLYCIRWKSQEGGKRTYRAPTSNDLKNEETIEALVQKNLKKWQKKGWIPSSNFDPKGAETSQPVRTRGWTHWHHLFTPRQLLYKALLTEEVCVLKNNKARVAGLLGVGCCANWNSRLSHWDKGCDNVQATFYNQALNPFYSFSSRGFVSLKKPFRFNFSAHKSTKQSLNKIMPKDASYKDLISSDPKGDKTSEPVRTRGWTHWHHLFTPRQLLYKAFLMEEVCMLKNNKARVAGLLGIGCCANWNSRLSHWHKGCDNVQATFYNQALNPFYSFSSHGFVSLKKTFRFNFSAHKSTKQSLNKIMPKDARDIDKTCDIWITDPPYADAVHYHELGDFFLAWYEKQMPQIFPEWYTDAKKTLAVRGSNGDFKHAMVEIYGNLCNNMPDDGLQVVMFAHQDSKVWADLGMILTRVGLRISNAWTIATETIGSGLKKGKYLRGTVLLVLRKRLEKSSGIMDTVIPELEEEVLRQLELMQNINELDCSDFTENDYQLAAYSAALRVATQYTHIEGLDITADLYTTKVKGNQSILEKLINKAIAIVNLNK